MCALHSSSVALSLRAQSTPEPNSPNTTGNRWSIIIDKVIVRSEEKTDLQFAPSDKTSEISGEHELETPERHPKEAERVQSEGAE